MKHTIDTRLDRVESAMAMCLPDAEKDKELAILSYRKLESGLAAFGIDINNPKDRADVEASCRENGDSTSLRIIETLSEGQR